MHRLLTAPILLLGCIAMGRAEEPCARCHPSEAAAFAQSPMGRSVGPPSVYTEGRIVHKLSGKMCIRDRDKQGNAYIGGTTCSTNFPTTAGSYSPAPPAKGANTGCNFGIDQSAESAFITKLNAAGSALVFSTYLGGSYADRVWAIAVDSSDNVYVGGYTNSFNFPVTAEAFQTVCAPVAEVYPSCPNTVTVSSCQGGSVLGSDNESGFVTKLNSTGSALVYSTFIGGSGNDGVAALAVNSSGEVYVAGNSASAVANETLCNPNPQTSFAWPTTPNGFEGWPTNGLPSGDQAHPAFSVFSADGSSLVYSTLYGPTTSSPGGNNTGVTSMAVDSAGKAYIGGYTNYATFPVTPGAYQTTCPGCAEPGNARADGFVVAFDPSQNGAASLVSVSYTHLDVYKRQTKYGVIRMKNPSARDE